MANNGWYKTGCMPKEDPATDKQLWFIRKYHEAVLDVLEPEERVSVELMGFQEWMGTLTKAEASGVIGILKGETVAHAVSRSTEVGSRMVAMSIEKKPSRKWFDTGMTRRKRS
jgi:hypothetical protein